MRFSAVSAWCEQSRGFQNCSPVRVVNGHCVLVRGNQQQRAGARSLPLSRTLVYLLTLNICWISHRRMDPAVVQQVKQRASTTPEIDVVEEMQSLTDANEKVDDLDSGLTTFDDPLWIAIQLEDLVSVDLLLQGVLDKGILSCMTNVYLTFLQCVRIHRSDTFCDCSFTTARGGSCNKVVLETQVRGHQRIAGGSFARQNVQAAPRRPASCRC